MLLRTAVAALVVAASVPAAASSSDRPSALVQRSGPAEVGKPFPSFAGFGLDGAMVSSRQLLSPRGGGAPRALVVSFFATWCEPCRANLPGLARAVAAAPGARAVLVHHGPEETDNVAAFLKKAQVAALPVILDPYLKISSRCGVTQALPRTFVLDGAGNVTAIFEFEGADFEASLAAVLAKVPAVPAASVIAPASATR